MCKTKKEAEPRARRSLPASSSFISHLPDAKQLESISEIDHSLSPSFSYSLPSHKKSLLTEFGIVGWRRERERKSVSDAFYPFRPKKMPHFSVLERKSRIAQREPSSLQVQPPAVAVAQYLCMASRQKWNHSHSLRLKVDPFFSFTVKYVVNCLNCLLSRQECCPGSLPSLISALGLVRK